MYIRLLLHINHQELVTSREDTINKEERRQRLESQIRRKRRMKIKARRRQRSPVNLGNFSTSTASFLTTPNSCL